MAAGKSKNHSSFKAGKPASPSQTEGGPDKAELKKLLKLEQAAAKEAQKRLQAEERERLEKARQEAQKAAAALTLREEALKTKQSALSRSLEADEPPAGGLLSYLRRGVAKTRESLTQGMGRLLLGKKEIDQEVLEGLEELLLTADMGVTTTRQLLDLVERKVRRKELSDPERLKSVLKDEISLILNRPQTGSRLEGHQPAVILFVGVNGVGKTTTIGKIAAQAVAEGRKVLLGAGDTFRAAAGEQLERWSQKTGADILREAEGADPASVIFKTLTRGVAENFDLVICDTAGRLHTKVNLLEELKKIKRVMEKALPGAPHETWLVLDANTGQNAIHQTREFLQAVEVTGIIVTKLDGTAKGGVVVGIVNEFNIPIRYVGVGEGVEDLRPFSPSLFAQSLFD